MEAAKTQARSKTVSITIEIEEEIIKGMEQALCERDVTHSLPTAFEIFAKSVANSDILPVEMMIDPFYKKENIDELKRRIEKFESGNREGCVTMTMEELEAMIFDPFHRAEYTNEIC